MRQRYTHQSILELVQYQIKLYAIHGNFVYDLLFYAAVCVVEFLCEKLARLNGSNPIFHQIIG